MILEFDRSFEKSLDKIKDKALLTKIENIIVIAERAAKIENIPNTKKLVGFTDYYRIKIGPYRLGVERINKTTIRFIIIEHRKDIYKKFPR